MMDPFKNLPETPDLSGQVTPLGYRPVFIGPYSCVYQGKLQSTGEIVAIKVLNAVEGSALHTMRRKLKRERRTWGALNHPNILPLYGFADDEDMFQPFGALISPWLQHGDASRFLAEHGDLLTLDQRVGLWVDVISGVEYLHSYKPLLVHGDLKPRNILINDRGYAQICDFGLVRIFSDEGGSGMTTTTCYGGTERYLAYELVIAGDEATPTAASDVYAVGCIGLEFIFLQLPYATRKKSRSGMIRLDIRDGIAPAERPSDFPSHLEVIWLNLERCWDRDPSKRPTANDLLRCDLGEISVGFATNPSANGQNIDLERTSPRDYSLGVPDLSSSIPEESQKHSQGTLNISEFTARQEPAAQGIHEYLKIHPASTIPAHLITFELCELDDILADYGWCLIGQCGLDRAAEKAAPHSGEQINRKKKRLDHLYDHIRDDHFKSPPFQSSLAVANRLQLPSSSAPAAGDSEAAQKPVADQPVLHSRKKQRPKPTFCFACGSRDHSAFQCTATEKAVGSRGHLFIRKEGPDWFIPGAIPGKNRVCYPFNLPAGCRSRVCDRGLHLCSLCGSSSHSALSCSA